jgi:hypothetical protein
MMDDRHFFPLPQFLATAPSLIWKGRNMLLKCWAVPLWLLACCGGALAEETAVQPVALTAASVEKFMATFPVLAARFSQADPEFDAADQDSLVGQISLMIEGDPNDSALDKAAAAQGYVSFDEWGSLAQNILIARQWAANPPDEAEVAASEAEIAALTDVSEDEKSQMIAGLHEAMGTAIAEKPSDANIETVRPFLGKLKEILGDGEQE